LDASTISFLARSIRFAGEPERKSLYPLLATATPHAAGFNL
jgi:hypothetical protein